MFLGGGAVSYTGGTPAAYCAPTQGNGQGHNLDESIGGVKVAQLDFEAYLALKKSPPPSYNHQRARG